MLLKRPLPHCFFLSQLVPSRGRECRERDRETRDIGVEEEGGKTLWLVLHFALSWLSWESSNKVNAPPYINKHPAAPIKSESSGDVAAFLSESHQTPRSACSPSLLLSLYVTGVTCRPRPFFFFWFCVPSEDQGSRINSLSQKQKSTIK